jgi:hypothetical protein
MATDTDPPTVVTTPSETNDDDSTNCPPSWRLHKKKYIFGLTFATLVIGLVLTLGGGLAGPNWMDVKISELLQQCSPTTPSTKESSFLSKSTGCLCLDRKTHKDDPAERFFSPGPVAQLCTHYDQLCLFYADSGIGSTIGHDTPTNLAAFETIDNFFAYDSLACFSKGPPDYTYELKGVYFPLAIVGTVLVVISFILLMIQANKVEEEKCPNSRYG